MVESLVRTVLRGPRWVLAGAALFVIAAGLAGGGLAGVVTTGGTSTTDAPSQQARAALESTFGAGAPDYLLLVTASSGDASSPAVSAIGLQLTAELAADPGVRQARSFWTDGDRALLSGDGARALIAASLGGDDDDRADTVERLRMVIEANDSPEVNVVATGFSASFFETGERVKQDLATAEAIGLSVVLVVLVAVFGGLVVAGVPLLMGVLAIIGSFLVLRLLALVTDVSAFALSVTISLGLGLAIDYSLFILARYREERAAGADHGTAIATSASTAGRTVVISGVVITVALSGLLIFPTVFLRSFAYAGIGVVIVAVVSAVVVVPALMAVLGEKRLAGRAGQRQVLQPGQHGRWYRVARTVMRRPRAVAAGAGVALLVAGAPLLSLDLGLADHRVLPPGSSSRTAQETVDASFAADAGSAIPVVAPELPSDSVGRTADFAGAVSAISGVTSVQGPDGTFSNGVKAAVPGDDPAAYRNGSSVWFNVTTSLDPGSDDAEELVRELRRVGTEMDLGALLVGGPTATFLDDLDVLTDRLPLALAWLIVASFALLLVAFGSVLIAAKAVLLNLLGLTATFGALVAVFQYGWGSGLLGFTETGTLEVNSLILIFAISYGLSMDYAVFLLSRISEEHDAGAPDEEAIAVGLDRSARVLTAAAVLISVVFLAQLVSGVTFIKQYGLGLALAVLIDAFVLRVLLVPSLMRLAGSANWWAPGWVHRMHRRAGLHVPARVPSVTSGPADGSHVDRVSV